MSIESPQPQFNEENKEAALRKVSKLAMKQQLQVKLMEEHGVHLTGDRQHDQETMHKYWIDDHSSEDFGKAFEMVMQEHPDLVDIFATDETQAMAMLREKFDEIHQTA